MAITFKQKTGGLMKKGKVELADFKGSNLLELTILN